MTLEELLIKEEGWDPCAYKDSEGFWTIGFGTLIDKRKGGGITKEEGLFLLRNRVNTFVLAVVQALPFVADLNEARRTVVFAMAYQMGVPGLLKFKNTLAAMARGEFTAAAIGMRRSKWYKQTPARAERMACAMESGVFA